MQKLLGTPNRAGNSSAPGPHRLNIPLACFILQPTGTPRPHINGFLLARTLTTVQNLGCGWVRYRPTTFSPTPQKGVGGTRALAHSILYMSDIAFMQKGPYYDEWKNPSAVELRCWRAPQRQPCFRKTDPSSLSNFWCSTWPRKLSRPWPTIKDKRMT